MSETQEKLNEWATGFFSVIQWKLDPVIYGGDAPVGSIGLVKTTENATLYFKWGSDILDWRGVVGP